MTPLPMSIVSIISVTAAVVSTTVRCCFSNAQGGDALGNVLRHALASLLRSTAIIVATMITVTIIAAARTRSRAREAVIDLFAGSGKGARGGEVFEATARTATAIASLG
jgi:hypothetical protein